MIKRVFDFSASIVMVISLSPVLLGCAAAVAFSMGRPVFFRQKRIGLNEMEFEIIKFRTMRPPKDGESMLLTDAQRVTRVGEFLRRTSLDELPELWNVVKGEMSLVGPRPLLDAHLKVFTPEQRRRHLVRPGLTGLAQISGRQNLTFGQRTALDVLYVDTQSFWGDIKILFKTVGVVFGGGGVETGQVFSDVDDVGLKKIIEDEAKAGSEEK
jgi:lipopolysaccharide/colanic/teichoic acid biosynthesis glycosyltransferase